MVTFVFVEKTKKDTWDRSWREFVFRGGIGIWKAKTAKNTNLIVIGMAKEKRVIGSDSWIGFGGANIEKKGDRVECFCLEFLMAWRTE